MYSTDDCHHLQDDHLVITWCHMMIIKWLIILHWSLLSPLTGTFQEWTPSGSWSRSLHLARPLIISFVILKQELLSELIKTRWRKVIISPFSSEEKSHLLSSTTPSTVFGIFCIKFPSLFAEHTELTESGGKIWIRFWRVQNQIIICSLGF